MKETETPNYRLTYKHQFFTIMQFQALRSIGAEGASATHNSLLICPFLLMSPLNVFYLKEVAKNAHENQQAKSRAS